MHAHEIDFIQQHVLTRKTVFPYFRGRYALMLLRWLIGPGRSVAELKRTRFAGLLDKPPLRAALARLPDGRLTPAALDLADLQPAQRYRLTLGRWGSSADWLGRQVSRPGANLVLHLNFPRPHNGAYAALLRGMKDEPYGGAHHPSAEKPLRTLAWARIDIDFDAGEALIEEIQSDWVRDVYYDLECYKRVGLRRMRRWLGRRCFTPRRLQHYVERDLAPHAAIWPEATLAATLWLLRDQIGIRRIYYHTFEGGCWLKGCDPPRSLYTDLPRRFGFTLTDRGPRLIADCREPRVYRRLLERHVRWFVLKL